MRHIRLLITLTLLATIAYSQQVPKLVRFNGSFRTTSGLPAQSTESVTLAVYRDQTGGDALWREIQNVAVDADGHYSVLMGGTKNEGMPVDLFTSAESRWLGVQFNRPGEAEQPRVLLVSVPYALKASDAETLGGKPASAYLLAAPAVGTETTRVTATTAVKPKAAPANSGMPNYIGKFANTTDLIDSAMYEVNGNVGIFTTAPAISLDVRTGSLPQMGIAGVTDYLTFFASDQYGPAIYWDPTKDMRFGKGGSGLYNPFGFVEQMRIQSSTGNVGIGTMTPGSTLDVAGDINLSGGVLFSGYPMLQSPGSVRYNTAVGLAAMVNNTTGEFNTANGYQAMLFNTTGDQNTANGYGALTRNTTGPGNTAIGYQALYTNTTGSGNVAIGVFAGSNLDGGSFNIEIGTPGFATDDRTTRIGESSQLAFFAGGVRGVTTTNNDAIPVVIDSAGQLGTVSSSRRFKEDISDMGAASQDLMRLRPVTYRYKTPFTNGSKPIQYGLIAEEVAEVYPDLVAHSADGQIETVKYQVLDSMLLNEMQRLVQHNQRLEERLARLEKALAATSGPGTR